MNNKIIKKTFRKIDAIAKTGKDGILDYKKFIDSIVTNNEYDILYEVMLRYYNIDIHEFVDIEAVKKNTFDKIRLMTKSPFQDNMNAMQKKMGFYNIGKEVFTDGNILIGSIYQIGEASYAKSLIDTYEITGSNEIDIYNKSISKLFLDYEH